MFVNEHEMNIDRMQAHHEQLRREAEQIRLVREARKARREETETERAENTQLVQRLFALFF